MVRQKIHKNSTYTFRLSSDEREMVKFLGKHIEVPDALRMYIRKLYNEKMGIKLKTGDPDDNIYG